MELPSNISDEIKKGKNKKLLQAYRSQPSWLSVVVVDRDDPNFKLATSKAKPVDGLTIDGVELTADVVCKNYFDPREAGKSTTGTQGYVEVEAKVADVATKLFSVTESGVIPPECQDLAEFIIQKL